jgi:hypothetical protein
MELTKKEKVRDMITTFAAAVHFDDQRQIDALVEKFSMLDEETIVVETVKTLARFHQAGRLDIQDVSDNVDKILCIAPDKYSSMEDLISMLRELRRMNMEHQAVPLEENHRLVKETFDKFNELIENEYFDCYYTGGLMGYLITDTPLVRYHGDLDMMFNEEQLIELMKVVEKSDDFSVVTSMDTKGDNGHEFAIRYRDCPMDIGLFLFSRDKEGAVTNKSYYMDNGVMKCVEEEHTVEYSDMAYDDKEWEYHGHRFKMLSLEDMYVSKRYSSRPKDNYDAELIEGYVDKEECERIRKEREKKDVRTVEVNGGIVYDLSMNLMARRKK